MKIGRLNTKTIVKTFSMTGYSISLTFCCCKKSHKLYARIQSTLNDPLNRAYYCRGSLVNFFNLIFCSTAWFRFNMARSVVSLPTTTHHFSQQIWCHRNIIIRTKSFAAKFDLSAQRLEILIQVTLQAKTGSLPFDGLYEIPELKKRGVDFVCFQEVNK